MAQSGPVLEMQFDAVLCDVDGVLRHWGDGMAGIDRAFGLPAGTLAAAAFAPHRLQPAITGTVTDAEWRSGVATDLATACGSAQRAQSVVDAWTALPARIDPEVLDLLVTARRRVPVALLSNATSRLEDDLKALGVLDSVDVVLSSARAGVAKPDVAIYHWAAERIGVEVARCLFVDDNSLNVDGARAAGMHAVHYAGVDSLRDLLSAW
jgi:putative hydrolase of the HAD superfamily